MKKKTLAILSLTLAALVAFMCIISASAATIIQTDGFSYTQIDNLYISVCGWDNSSESLKIPAQLDGRFIKEIGNKALEDNTYITSVDFSSAYYLNRIGLMAFKGCTGLAGNLTLPYRIVSIDMSAFRDCDSITSVDFYADTETIPDACFYSCDSLNIVVIDDGVNSISKLAFANCPELESVKIASSVTYINPTAFSNSPNVVIYCYTDSYAHSFAEDNGIEYVLIDGPVTPDPTEPVTEATEATEATEPPTTAPEGYILGDADGSGNVDIVDATFAQRYVTHSDIPAEILSGMDVRADVDSNGEVEATDVTFIMRYLIHIATPYPIGEVVTGTATGEG